MEKLCVMGGHRLMHLHRFRSKPNTFKERSNLVNQLIIVKVKAKVKVVSRSGSKVNQ